MATIVNTPPAEKSEGSNSALMILVVLVLGIIFIYYALPVLRQGATTPQAPSVTVPDQIDVNINQPNK